MTAPRPLLPQPGGFEGFALSGEHAICDDLPTAHGAHLPVAHLNLSAAALAPATQVRCKDDAVACGYVFLDVGVGLLEVPPESSRNLRA